MKSHRIAFLLSFFTISVLLWSGCASDNSKKDAATSAVTQVVSVGYLPMISAVTHYVAVERGLYKRYDLEVSATKIATSNLLASQLVDGKLDCAIELSIVPLLKAMKPGAATAEFKIFSTSSVTADKSFDGIVVKPGSSIRSLGDLAGKRVATFPGTTASSSLTYAFAQVAPGRPLPTCKATAPDLQLQALETDAVDALYCYEPTLSRAIASGLRLLPKSGIYALLQDKSPVGVAAINGQFAASRPEACRKLVTALDEAAQYVRDHPKEAREILAKAEKVNASVTASMHDLNMGTSSEVSFNALERFESLLAKMKESGPKPLTKDYIYKP